MISINIKSCKDDHSKVDYLHYSNDKSITISGELCKHVHVHALNKYYT